MDDLTVMTAEPIVIPSDAAPEAWQAVLALAATGAGAGDLAGPLGALYGPLLDGAAAGRFVVAHLGQSLDGRIALPDGESVYVTGRDDAAHNHRLRALHDAVIVGARTVARDDPRLTVRLVAGDNPVRVVIDPRRRLDTGLGVFTDLAAPTLLICAETAAAVASRHGEAEIVALPARADGSLAPRAIVDALATRGLTSLFIEGGGATVSRFIEAGLVDRLQITAAPILMGNGHPVLTLSPIARIEMARRLHMRPFVLGADLLYDCTFDGRS